MEIETTSTRVIYDPIHDPIDIGEEGAECCKYNTRANFRVFNGRGEYERRDYLLLNVFASSEIDARQRVAEFFQTLNCNVERQGSDMEIELVDVMVFTKQ